MARPLVWIALAASFGLAGCVHEDAAPPRTSQLVVQMPDQLATSPGPPPPPHSELVPPPPPDMGPVVWQPGHWQLSGTGWIWQSGRYVPPPVGQTTWVPGRWLQQPSGSWSWVEGHWA
jgi:WXXGXW repeat (2 copies)